MKKAASTTKRTTSKKPKTEGLGVIGELDRYLFGEGRHYQLYHKLGAHPYTYRGQDGYYFAVWAPHAAAVSLVGDFNAWNPDATPMKPVADSGIYELFVPGLGVGQLYKFAITTHTGTILFKADPYAFSAEYRPGTASVTADIRGFKWNDSKWMESRAGTDPVKAPISIYEVHLGSWKKKNRPEKDGYYTYMEAAHELADYVLEMGYTVSPNFPYQRIHTRFQLAVFKPVFRPDPTFFHIFGTEICLIRQETAAQLRILWLCLLPFPVKRTLKAFTVLHLNVKRHQCIRAEIITRPLIRFQRPDHEIIMRSQIDLPIVHRCITPRSINSLVGSLFNDLSLFLQIRKPFSGHKIILHTVPLACPDRSGRIRHHRPDLRQPLSQYLIDRVLPGRALSHHVKYMSHLPIMPFQPVFSHAFHRIYKSDFSLIHMANVRTW